MAVRATDEDLSPSSLAYLFANRFVVRAEPGTRGMKSFAAGVIVDTRALAVNLPVIALWSMSNSGQIALQSYDDKGRRGVRAVLRNLEQSSGLEGEFFQQLARTRQATDVGVEVAALVRGLIPKKTPLPFEAVVQIALMDVIEKGYLTRVPNDRGIAGRLKRGPKWTVEPHPERYGPLVERVDLLSGPWRDFGDDLYKSLRDISRTAIESRRRTGDTVLGSIVSHVVDDVNSGLID